MILGADIGILKYLIAPLAVVFSFFLLWFSVKTAVSVELISIRIFYSAAISLPSTALIFATGVVGKATISKVILYILIFISLIVIFKVILKKQISLNILKWVLAIPLGILAIAALVYMSIHFWHSAGWIKEEATVVFNNLISLK